MSVVTGLGPVNVSGLSDDELVRLARDGHEDAFDAIVRRYRAPLTSYCRRWLDGHRAEEVVQHTMMKAFLCLRDDDRPLVLRPWLYRVAHNAALNALEKKGSDWDELDENYDGVPQPPQVAEKRAHFLRVVHEIEELPQRQRQALVLNEFEGRCYADIAAELGTSESGVRGLLRRARRQLREAAAAVLLPFPALRELVRSDAGRSFQTERAGEFIGSAGAAGGLSAAGGGLAKIAAGVLAAGTLAGGGSALQHGETPWKAPQAQAQGVIDPVRTDMSARLVGGTEEAVSTAVSDTSNDTGAAKFAANEYYDDTAYDGAPLYTYSYKVSAEIGEPVEEPAPDTNGEAGEGDETDSAIDRLVPDELTPGRDEEDDEATKGEENTVSEPEDETRSGGQRHPTPRQPPAGGQQAGDDDGWDPDGRSDSPAGAPATLPPTAPLVGGGGSSS